MEIFLIALGNSYACNTIVYRCTEKDTWRANINNPEKHYTKTLYFAMTDKDHVDLVLNTDDQRAVKDRIIEYRQNQIQILKLHSMSHLPKLSEN